ncbi:SLC13 family permease, partial [Acinetobacter baumannii]
LRLRRDPMPYLLAVAMASNVGSVATITGNPQNMIIGTVSGLSYGGFAAALAPVALTGAVMTAVLIAVVYRREIFGGGRLV